MEFRSIDIDFDVHKKIESERRSFAESPNDALRRLLGLGTSPISIGVKKSPTGERAWSDEGVTLQHGTLVRMEYGRPKRVYSGRIADGLWIVEGEAYHSPSGAASGVAVTSTGSRTRLNGWGLWFVKRPDDMAWVSLAKLRREAEPIVKAAADELLKELGLLDPK